MTSSERLEILDFLKRNPMGVISTIDIERYTPESALVAFGETLDFEIIFQTLNTARKYANLMENPHISFVTGWEIEKSQQITFQYEGRAFELENNTADYQKYRTLFEQKETPCTSEFLDNPHSRIFVISPIWLGYSDYRGEIPRVIEHSF